MRVRPTSYGPPVLAFIHMLLGSVLQRPARGVGAGERERSPGGAADREIEREHRANQRYVREFRAQLADLALLELLLYFMVHCALRENYEVDDPGVLRDVDEPSDLEG